MSRASVGGGGVRSEGVDVAARCNEHRYNELTLA